MEKYSQNEIIEAKTRVEQKNLEVYNNVSNKALLNEDLFITEIDPSLYVISRATTTYSELKNPNWTSKRRFHETGYDIEDSIVQKSGRKPEGPYFSDVNNNINNSNN